MDPVVLLDDVGEYLDGEVANVGVSGLASHQVLDRSVDDLEQTLDEDLEVEGNEGVASLSLLLVLVLDGHLLLLRHTGSHFGVLEQDELVDVLESHQVVLLESEAVNGWRAVLEQELALLAYHLVVVGD